MPDDEDYYEILGVPSDATHEQIKEAYIYKVNIYHPDRLAGTTERIRRKAEEELKKVNEAYAVLSSPGKRRQYDAKRFGSISKSDLRKAKPAGKPKAEVYPKVIRFNNVLPYVKQKGAFFIRNVGGQYKKVLISQPPEWIRVVKTTPLQDHGKLPMRVEIEATGVQWGGTYSSQVVIRLDESEARVRVKLKTQKKPRKFP